MIKQNRNLFAEKDIDLGKTKTVEVKIDTRDHLPVKLKPYLAPFAK